MNRSSQVRRTTFASVEEGAGIAQPGFDLVAVLGRVVLGRLGGQRVDRLLVAVEGPERQLALRAPGSQFLAQHHAEEGGEVRLVDRADELGGCRDLGAVDDEADQADRDLVEERAQRVFADLLGAARPWTARASADRRRAGPRSSRRRPRG